MRKYFIYFSITLFIFLTGTYLLVQRFVYNDRDPLLSPLPSFLSVLTNGQVSTIDIWNPSLNSVEDAISKEPTISARSALVFDLTSNKAIYQKNPKERLPMASLTKIMTAIVAIENKREDDRYIVYPENIVGENSMGVSPGEVYSLEELLYGLILYSGNDAAEVLAANTLGRYNFIDAMNAKAKALGLKNTNFTNPSGLEGDGKQYTTTYDLLVITRYALSSHPEFAKVVATVEKEIPENRDHKAFSLSNQTNLLTSYPGVKGVKDGYTPEAGLCLVTYIDYGGHEMVGIILGSNNRRQEMKDLLDYSLSIQGVKPPPHS